MTESGRIGSYDILMAECLVVREAIIKTSQKDIQLIIIQSDSILMGGFLFLRLL